MDAKIKKGSWVRIASGEYAGRLGTVVSVDGPMGPLEPMVEVDLKDHGEMVRVWFYGHELAVPFARPGQAATVPDLTNLSHKTHRLVAPIERLADPDSTCPTCGTRLHAFPVHEEEPGWVDFCPNGCISSYNPGGLTP